MLPSSPDYPRTFVNSIAKHPLAANCRMALPVSNKVMTGARRFGDFGTLEFLVSFFFWTRACIQSRAIYSKSMGSGKALNNKTIFYTFLTSSFFLRRFLFRLLMSQRHPPPVDDRCHAAYFSLPVNLTSSAPLPDRTIILLTCPRNQSPFSAVPPVLHSGPQILAPAFSGIPLDPLPIAFLAISSVRRTPPRPYRPNRPHRPHGPGEQQQRILQIPDATHESR